MLLSDHSRFALVTDVCRTAKSVGAGKVLSISDDEIVSVKFKPLNPYTL
jgi:hypothetical protein